jgi:hypothetical protein
VHFSLQEINRNVSGAYMRKLNILDAKRSVSVARESSTPAVTNKCFKECHFGTLSAINTKENEET